MIQLDLQPDVEAQLAAEANLRGLALNRYIENLVISCLPNSSHTNSSAEAVAAIREGRKGIRLNGLKISNLIQEGRKY